MKNGSAGALSSPESRQSHVIKRHFHRVQSRDEIESKWSNIGSSFCQDCFKHHHCFRHPTTSLPALFVDTLVVSTMMYSRVANATLSRSRIYTRRWLSNVEKKAKGETLAPKETEVKKSWWNSAEFWGFCSACAGWGMSGSAIYDAALQGPEVISLNMTVVLIIYSSLLLDGPGL